MSDAPAAKMILVGGGARSGKSRFALDLARTMGDRRVFIATGQALDDEMAHRIARHRRERGADFHTIEEPFELAAAIDAHRAADVVLVDCLTLWVSNLLVRGRATSAADVGAPWHARGGSDAVTAAFDGLEASLACCPVPVILVTNEVGLGLVPDTALGRDFRDAIGGLHQRLAARAKEIYAALLGVVLRLHPAPVEVIRSRSPISAGLGGAGT